MAKIISATKIKRKVAKDQLITHQWRIEGGWIVNRHDWVAGHAFTNWDGLLQYELFATGFELADVEKKFKRATVYKSGIVSDDGELATKILESL